MDVLQQQLIEWINYDLSFDNEAQNIALKDQSSLKQRLISVVQPTVRMSRILSDKTSCPLGVSKVGGLPHLPPYVAWPCYQDKPLGFLAQINLAELHQAYAESSAIPKQGLLYFFMDIREWTEQSQSSLRVLYTKDINDIMIRLSPATALGSLEEQRIGMSHEKSYSLPCYVDGIKIHDTLLEEIYGLQNCTSIGHVNPAELSFGLLAHKRTGHDKAFPLLPSCSRVQVGHLLGYPSNSRVYWGLRRQEIHTVVKPSFELVPDALVENFSLLDDAEPVRQMNPIQMPQAQAHASLQRDKTQGDFVQFAVFEGLWLGLGDHTLHFGLREQDLQAGRFENMRVVIDRP